MQQSLKLQGIFIVFVLPLVLGCELAACELVGSSLPSGFVLIPAGAFQMGDVYSERNPDERPIHRVQVSAFYLSKTEVTLGEWREVSDWALQHGYTFENPGSGKAGNHPVEGINWYDVAKWCNAKSEKEGLMPVYYSDPKFTAVYRTGQFDLFNDCLKWQAHGYRLPTEAEWEKSARGGKVGRRYPWGGSVTHDQANFHSETDFAFDISPTRGHHPKYKIGNPPFTSPVGSFAPNDYGLYDISGNVWEFCWDWYDPAWYKIKAAAANDTRGPTGPTPYRAIRGGGWDGPGRNLRCAVRDHALPGKGLPDLGFRLVRSALR